MSHALNTIFALQLHSTQCLVLMDISKISLDKLPVTLVELVRSVTNLTQLLLDIQELHILRMLLLVQQTIRIAKETLIKEMLNVKMDINL